MTDVSCRAFAYFEIAARQGLVDLEELLAPLPLSRAQLEQRRGRVPWDDWAALCDRFGDLAGLQGIEQSSRAALDPAFMGTLIPIARMIVAPRDIYHIGLTWFAPMTYRNLTFEMRDVSPSRIDVTITVPPTHRGSMAWMRMVDAALGLFPNVVGLPSAVVEADLHPHRSHFAVTLPSTGSTASWFARGRWALRGASAMLDELGRQQQELTQTHRSLLRAERAFQGMVDALPMPVAIHRGSLRYANHALRRLLGSDNDVIGRPLAHWVHDDDDARKLQRFVDGDVATVDVRLRRSTGSVVHVRATAVTELTFDGVVADMFVLEDRTAVVDAQTALADSERTQRLLLALHPDLVLRFNRQSDLLDLHAGTAFPGVGSLLPFVGLNVDRLMETIPDISNELFLKARALMLEALDTGEIRALEIESAALGSLKTFEIRIVPSHIDEVLVIVRDVTEQQRLAQQLFLAERMASVGTVAAGVAHEVNNPLSFVMTNLALAEEELASERPFDRASLREWLAEAHTGAQRVADIIAALNVFARGAEHERRPVDVREVLRSAVAMTSNALRHKAKLLIHDSKHQNMSVWANANQLAQVLVNLIANATQAIPDGAVDDHVVEIRLETKGDLIEVSVRDTGVGMSPDEQRQAFNPFFTTKHGSGGSGLGLSICHRIVAEHGGTIAVESTLGRGTTFTIRLPASPAGSPHPASVEPPPPPLARRGRVLVVDDEFLVGRSLARALRDHDVMVAHDGEEALRVIEAERPFDIILCDLMMPGMTGLELHRRLGECHPEAADKVVFMSGGALTDQTRQAANILPDRIVSKPVALERLRALVAHAVNANEK